MTKSQLSGKKPVEIGEIELEMETDSHNINNLTADSGVPKPHKSSIKTVNQNLPKNNIEQSDEDELLLPQNKDREKEKRIIMYTRPARGSHQGHASVRSNESAEEPADGQR